ncbi:hypothetical protein KC336_g18277 [Hortaea werneckii]|nr:hypothetical protein KC336_g18277 [Hortaea werneckii]
MSRRNQRPSRHYPSSPSLADETDGLAADFRSLGLDGNGTDPYADSTESVSHRPRKKAQKTPGVFDSRTENGEHEDGEHEDGEHEDGEHEDGEHEDGEHEDGEHEDCEYEEYEDGEEEHTGAESDQS